MGNYADAKGNYATAVGEGAYASASNSLAIGVDSEANGEAAVSIGVSNANGTTSIAIGYQANTTGISAISIGNLAEANYENSVAIGRAVSDGEFATAIGADAYASGYLSIAFAESDAKATSSVAFGGAQVNTPNTFGVSLDGSYPEIYATSTFYITGGDLRVGSTTNYWKTSELDLSGSALGDQGYYPMLSAYSDGALGNVGTIADTISIYDTQDDDFTTLSFVGNQISHIGTIDYNGDTFIFDDVLGGTASVDITGDLIVEGTGTSTIAGNLEITGKLTAIGGIDPPYVSYTDESCDSIREYYKQGVKDNVMQFWNAENRRFEYYLADEDECYPLGYQGELGIKVSWLDKLINLIKIWTKH
jgi:hypothetical protein